MPSIPGHEICGVVEAVAAGVESVAIGDEIYGLTSFVRDGGAAQFVATAAAHLASKPASTDFVQRAAVPLSTLTAWQAFFDHANLAAGRVLIHGGAGGVGTFAIQRAHERGARVVTTTSARNEDFVRSLGADVVIDYATARFDEEIADVNVVLDTVGDDTLARSFRVVRPGGLVVSLVGPIPERLLASPDRSADRFRHARGRRRPGVSPPACPGSVRARRARAQSRQDRTRGLKPLIGIRASRLYGGSRWNTSTY
jgi:NADPH:quinone reductase-like Zn-dependent oxidoreductase